ncbi:MAG TPA: VWA domain-containing protein [Planctomycetota bacterium]|nr:VWA domain-containing protein [Planctomycetota bacterium]
MLSFLTSFFGNPALLGGAAAGSIPIIIHLLNRQRFKKIAWAAMHWLWASFKKSQRRLQIEQLILLIIRVLLLVLLAFALARPALQEGFGIVSGTSALHRVIVLDNSYSMGQQVGGTTLFQKAKDRAIELTGKLTPADEVDVILANVLYEELTPKSTMAKDEVVNLIKAAPLSDGGTDMPRAVAAACRLLNERKSSNARKEIVVITDKSRSAWEQGSQPRRISGDDETAVQTAFSNPKSKPRILVMRLSGDKEVDNVAAVSVEVDEKIVPARVETQFIGTVQSFSDSNKSVKVKLKIDGEEVASETIQSLTKGKTESVSFRHTFPDPGAHSVGIELEGDVLAADNSAYLALDVEEQMRVLCVDGEQRTEPNTSETDFLRQALNPSRAEEINAGKMPLLPEVISDSRFLEESLDNYRLIILCNVATIPPEKVQAMEQFVKNGGAIWFFLGGRVDPAIYNRELASLLPMTIGEPIGGEDPNGPTEKLGDKETSHPAIERIKGNKFMSLSHLEVWKRFRLIPPAQPDPSVRTVLAYENGDVAAVEKRIGENNGRVLLFGTTADKAWHDWPAKGLFMPLINYIALDLIQPAYLQRNRLYAEKFSIQLPREDIGAARREGIRLMDPAGEASSMEVLTEQSRVESSVIRKAGVYTAEIPGDKRRTIHFAANRNIEESNLETIEDKELLVMIPRAEDTSPDKPGYFKSLISQADLDLVGDDVKEAEEKMKKHTGSREIWRWLAGTVLALLLVESFLARRFGDFTR